LLLALTAASLAACGTSSDDGDGDDSLAILPGQAIGPVTLGATLAELEVAAPGQFATPEFELDIGNVFVATYETRGLEILFSTPPNGGLTSDSIVVSVAAIPSDDVKFSGPATPNEAKAEIVARSGDASESFGAVDYYEAGFSVGYRTGDVAQIVAVFPPYTLLPQPPEMLAYPDR
jgi:hypothetical protein